MMLLRRVKRLERGLDPLGRRRCSCREDTRAWVVWYEDDPMPEMSEKTCSACGGVREPLLVHVVYDDPPAREKAPASTGAEGGER